MRTSTTEKGFTLIELMIVVAIISILATMAMPSYMDRVIQNQVKEGLALSEFAKLAVAETYSKTKAFPRDNTAAGLPPADRIVGNYVNELKVTQGVITITYGNQSNSYLVGKKLSLRPAIVDGFPQVPIAWVCGLATVPEKMAARGDNETDIPLPHLPIDCRSM